MISLRDRILKVSRLFGPLNHAELDSLFGRKSDLYDRVRDQGQDPYIDALLRFARDGSLPSAEVHPADDRRTGQPSWVSSTVSNPHGFFPLRRGAVGRDAPAAPLLSRNPRRDRLGGRSTRRGHCLLPPHGRTEPTAAHRSAGRLQSLAHCDGRTRRVVFPTHHGAGSVCGGKR